MPKGGEELDRFLAGFTGTDSPSPKQYFDAIRSLLAETVPAPEHVATLTRALQRIQGVTTLPAVDRFGRKGTAYTISTGRDSIIQFRLIISAEWGLMEEEKQEFAQMEFVLSDAAILEYMTYHEARYVDRLGVP